MKFKSQFMHGASMDEFIEPVAYPSTEDARRQASKLRTARCYRGLNAMLKARQGSHEETMN
jgi:hypothetical protein